MVVVVVGWRRAFVGVPGCTMTMGGLRLREALQEIYAANLPSRATKHAAWMAVSVALRGHDDFAKVVDTTGEDVPEIAEAIKAVASRAWGCKVRSGLDVQRWLAATG